MFKWENIVNNLIMKVFRFLNKYQSALLVAFTISSVFTVLAELCALSATLFSGNVSEMVGGLSDIFTRLVAYLFCFFLTMTMSKGKRGIKGFWCVICLSLLDNMISKTDYTALLFVLSVILSLFAIFCFDNFDAWIAFIFTLVASLLTGFLLNYLDGTFNDLIMYISSFVSDKGIISSAFVGLLEPVSSLFGTDAVLEPIFHNSFGGSYFVDGSIVTGAKDLFEAGFDGNTTSYYLSGHYFTLFLIVGTAVSLADELKGVQRLTLIIISASAILSGNISLYVLFLFFESPLLFLSFCFVNVICYLSAGLIKLNMGYLLGGSVFELIQYLDNTVYLLTGGVIFVCIGYFTTRLVIAKYGISDCLNTYIPSRLNRVVAAVGGITNIIKFKNGRLEVRNPELVNTLSIKCEINGSLISSEDLDFIELQDYL